MFVAGRRPTDRPDDDRADLVARIPDEARSSRPRRDRLRVTFTRVDVPRDEDNERPRNATVRRMLIPLRGIAGWSCAPGSTPRSRG